MEPQQEPAPQRPCRIGDQMHRIRISPIALKRGMDKAVEQIVSSLEKSAAPVKGTQEIRNIATVTSNGDRIR